MKKILALVLALMLVLSTSMVAFATTVEDNNGSATGDVNIKITATSEEGDDPIENPDDVDPEDATYAVDIDLADYEFTYNLGTYNTSTLQYDNGAGWVGGTEKSFNVTNRSNTSLDVTAKFSNSAATIVDKGVTAAIDQETFGLASAAYKSTAPTQEVKVSVSGAPTDATGWKISTITLSFAGATK